jgi:hypothetical protein
LVGPKATPGQPAVIDAEREFGYDGVVIAVEVTGSVSRVLS